jgi:hypothetical protein
MVTMTAPDDREAISVFPQRFYIRYIQKPGDKVEEQHRLVYVKAGHNGASTDESINALRKNQMLWPRFERAYEAWLKGQEAPEDGTPIGAWPGCMPEQAERLRALNLRTVEAVANMTDADMDRVGMGARRMRDDAKAYLVAAQDTAKTAAILTEARKENDDLRAELEELKALVAQIGDERGEDAPKRRGRPPKPEAA